jgi:hypothetical protein
MHLAGLCLTLSALGCESRSPNTDDADDEVGETTAESDTEAGTETVGETADTADTGDTGDTETGDGDGDGDEQIVEFASGSLIIPMDTDYQDMGMLEAFGLVYRLLQAEVPIHWAIAQGKQAVGDVDFTTAAIDLRTSEVIAEHGYRGGPFVVDLADAELARPIIEAWLADNPNTNVHEASAGFEVWVARRLLSAPTIAVFADGNEDIARSYLLAAKIPDSAGDPDWPDDSPDMLDPEEVAGPSDSDHKDGALFGGGGSEVPLYCQFMSMHWDVNAAETNLEVVAEVRSYLGFPTHFFAECQAVNAFENIGHFLSPVGLEIANQPDTYSFHRLDTPFGQIDGPFDSVGGSEPAYSVPVGATYFQADTTLITDATSPESVGDVWMTGYRDGQCPASAKVCPGAGKVSYLGGHSYSVNLPISQNPTTQGTRLFLNSLFEAPCAFK